MTLFNRKIVSYILIFAIAMVTGLSIGKIYVDNLEAPSTVSADESSLREKQQDVEEWVARAEGGAPVDSFSVVEFFCSFRTVLTGPIENR